MSNTQDLPRIYLDTNHWIELSRIAKGKNDDPTCKKLYSELLELSNSDEILIPFSSFNFFDEEQYKVLDKEQKDIVLASLKFAEESPWPDPIHLGEDVLAP